MHRPISPQFALRFRICSRFLLHNSGRIFPKRLAVLEKSGLNYVVENDYKSGSEARIEVKLADALGRFWSGPFMAVPVHAQTPTLICSMFGTMERLVGLILEHYQGILPLWLAPEQARLIPLSEEASRYASQIHRTLENEGIRCEIDTQDTDLGS